MTWTKLGGKNSGLFLTFRLPAPPRAEEHLATTDNKS